MDGGAVWAPFEIVHADFARFRAADERRAVDEHQWSRVRQPLS